MGKKDLDPHGRFRGEWVKKKERQKEGAVYNLFDPGTSSSSFSPSSILQN